MPIDVYSASELARISRKSDELICQLSRKEGTQSAMKNISMLVDDCLFHAKHGRTEKNHSFSIPNTIKEFYGKSPECYNCYDTDRAAYEEAYTSTIINFFSPYGYHVYVSERDIEENHIILTISWEGAEEND